MLSCLAPSSTRFGQEDNIIQQSMPSSTAFSMQCKCPTIDTTSPIGSLEPWGDSSHRTNCLEIRFALSARCNWTLCECVRLRVCAYCLWLAVCVCPSNSFNFCKARQKPLSLSLPAQFRWLDAILPRLDRCVVPLTGEPIPIPNSNTKFTLNQKATQQKYR